VNVEPPCSDKHHYGAPASGGVRGEIYAYDAQDILAFMYDASECIYDGSSSLGLLYSRPQTANFKGKERDTETGNDDFGARYYSNRFGRWLSADWSAVPVAVPYANLTNPQTLNLYSMVADDPESFADLDGHCCEDALDFGKEVFEGPTPAEKFVGGAIIAAAVIGTVATNWEAVKDAAGKVGDFLEANPMEDTQMAPVNAVFKLAEQQKNSGTQTTPGGEAGSRPGQDFTPAGKKVIDARDGDKCQSCGRDVSSQQNKPGKPTRPDQRQRHHKKPKKDGGSGTPENGETLCPGCHKDKHNNTNPPPPPQPPPATPPTATPTDRRSP